MLSFQVFQIEHQINGFGIQPDELSIGPTWIHMNRPNKIQMAPHLKKNQKYCKNQNNLQNHGIHSKRNIVSLNDY